MMALYKDGSGLVLVVTLHQYEYKNRLATCSRLFKYCWQICRRASICELTHDVRSRLLGLQPLIVIPLYMWQRD